jgi:hypothetical protein
MFLIATFVLWALWIFTLTAQEKSLVIVNFSRLAVQLLLAEAFLVGAIWRCHLAFYRWYLPLVGGLFVYSVLWVLKWRTLGFLGSLSPEGEFEPWPKGAPTLIQETLAGVTWVVFWIVVYFLVHVRANRDRFEHIFFINKLPTVALILVMISFFREFPEYDWLRKLLKEPGARVIEGIVLSVDTSLVAILCLGAGLGWGLRKPSSPTDETGLR